MQVKETIDLILSGDGCSKEVETLYAEVLMGIKAVVWPLGAKDFSIFPVKQANGVKPIKDECIAFLQARGWEAEKAITFGVERSHGPIDAIRTMANGKLFAVEWETGNISSSHRALNKMLLGLKRGLFGAAVLILPTRAMYKYLTDRVGNIDELRPYFEIWRLPEVEGRLTMISIEHDREDMSVKKIPKGTDGRSKKRRRKESKGRKKHL